MVFDIIGTPALIGLGYFLPDVLVPPQVTWSFELRLE